MQIVRADRAISLIGKPLAAGIHKKSGPVEQHNPESPHQINASLRGIGPVALNPTNNPLKLGKEKGIAH